MPIEKFHAEWRKCLNGLKTNNLTHKSLILGRNFLFLGIKNAIGRRKVMVISVNHRPNVDGVDEVLDDDMAHDNNHALK